MRTIVAVLFILAIACATLASNVYIHIHRTLPGELGVWCSNGGDPTVIGREEKYLIVSCGK